MAIWLAGGVAVPLCKLLSLLFFLIVFFFHQCQIVEDVSCVILWSNLYINLINFVPCTIIIFFLGISHPPNELEYIIQDSGAKLVITTFDEFHKLPSTCTRVYCLNSDEDFLQENFTYRHHKVFPTPTPSFFSFLTYSLENMSLNDSHLTITHSLAHSLSLLSLLNHWSLLFTSFALSCRSLVVTHHPIFLSHFELSTFFSNFH